MTIENQFHDHKVISYVKSAVRSLGYALGAFAFYGSDYGAAVALAFAVLIFSEILGIAEEWVVD